MTWAWNTNALKVTAELNTWRTFSPNSFAFILSLVTWDSAISALSLASFNSCCCFLYLERYWLASASYENKKWNKSLSLYNHIFFLPWCEKVEKMWERNLNFWVLNEIPYFCMMYMDSDFLAGTRSILQHFFPLEIENIVGTFHQQDVVQLSQIWYVID